MVSLKVHVHVWLGYCKVLFLHVFYFHSPSQMLVPGTGSNSDLERGNARQMSQLKAQLIQSYRGGGRLQHHTASTLLACSFLLLPWTWSLVTGQSFHWSVVVLERLEGCLRSRVIISKTLKA